MIPDMLSYYRSVESDRIIFLYNGPIWAEGIEGIGGTLRKRLEYDELPLSASQAVFSVFVEQMNNILMYSAEGRDYAGGGTGRREASKGIFILGDADGKYFVQSGNVVRNRDVTGIRERIEHLNTLDRDGLRKYYKQQIRSENPNPESRGAGLGLIEIARRASSRIDYAFTPYDENHNFFSLFVTIG